MHLIMRIKIYVIYEKERPLLQKSIQNADKQVEENNRKIFVCKDTV